MRNKHFSYGPDALPLGRVKVFLVPEDYKRNPTFKIYVITNLSQKKKTFAKLGVKTYKLHSSLMKLQKNNSKILLQAV